MKQLSSKMKNILSWLLTISLAVVLALSINLIVSSCKRQDLVEMEISFTVQDAQGNEVALSDFAGKPVVINFWAIWCPPCKQELPDFQAAYEKYGDEVEFLFVEVVNWKHETVADVEAFMTENGYDFPVYYDVSSDAETVCGVSSIPLSIFIGKDGKVKRTFLGAIPEFVLNNYIEEIVE